MPETDNLIKRIAPPSGVAKFRAAPIQNESQIPSATSGVEFYIHRGSSILKDAAEVGTGAAELGASLTLGPAGVLTDLDGGLKVARGIVRVVAGFAMNDSEYSDLRKKTELVSLIGIGTLLTEKLTSSMHGQNDIDLDEAAKKAEFLNAFYGAAKGIGTLTKPRKPDQSEAQFYTKNFLAAGKVSKVLSSGGGHTSQSTSGGEGSRENHGVQTPDPHQVGDFPNHIPKASGDGTMVG